MPMNLKNMTRHFVSFGIAVLAARPNLAVADVTPLLRGPEVDQATLEAFAKAEDRMTLAEYYDANRPQKNNEDRITHTLERAQSQWLSGSLDAARSTFKELAASLTDDDWREAHREAIAYSMLRLAQSAASPLEANEWIQKVAQEIPDYQPESTLFPPPILKSLNEARERSRAFGKEVDLAARFAEYRFVLINGRRFDVHAKKPVRLPPGVFRLSAYSDSRAPITEKMNASQLARFKAASPPLALGTCGSPQFFDVPRYSGPLSVLFEGHCVRAKADTIAAGDPSPPAISEGPHTANLNIANLGVEKATEPKWPTDEKPKGMSTLAKATWITLGLSALAVGIMLANENTAAGPASASTIVQPTVREGF